MFLSAACGPLHERQVLHFSRWMGEKIPLSDYVTRTACGINAARCTLPVEHPHVCAGKPAIPAAALRAYHTKNPENSFSGSVSSFNGLLPSSSSETVTKKQPHHSSSIQTVLSVPDSNRISRR